MFVVRLEVWGGGRWEGEQLVAAVLAEHPVLVVNQVWVRGSS